MPTNKQYSRRAERLKAFQVLYGLQFIEIDTIEELQKIFLNIPKIKESDTPDIITTDNELWDSFSWEIVKGVWQNIHRLDTIISQCCENWRVDRLGKIELTLLRMAIFEIVYRPDVPPKVALNEALELAARFGDTKAKKFINGILDAAVKSFEAGTLNTTTV